MASPNTVFSIIAGIGIVAAGAWFVTGAQDGALLPAGQPAGVTTVASEELAADETVQETITEPSAGAEQAVPQSEEQIQLSFAPVVQKVAPAVVNVYATRVEAQTSPFANDPFFQRFFGRQSPFPSRPRTSQSLGSGVIVDPSGLILTNSHVVSGATDIRIALSNRRELSVELVLDDPETDLAVLRLSDAPDEPLPALNFADSDELEVGDLVLAIGNPFGVGQTVTSGIVSALARTGVEASDYEFFIQTDAAINPGNSGGALVDLEGNLVGINTAIFSRSGGSVGIGFAIPSNMAQVVAEAGLSGGGIVRPWLGARMQQVTTEIAESIQLETPAGAIINEIAPGGPAAQAGLQVGDVVTAVNGNDVTTPATLNFRLATLPIGDEAELTVIRGGEVLSLLLPVAAPATDRLTAEIEGNTRFAGARAQALDPPLAEEFDLPYEMRGVIITEILTGSPADVMGLAVGDVILELNGIKVSDIETFTEIASQRPRLWEITLRRDGRTIRTRVSG